MDMNVQPPLTPSIVVIDENLSNPPAQGSLVVQLALGAVSTEKETTSTKSKRLRCDFQGCTKRIGVIEALCLKCLCEKTFCSSHRFFKDHECTFDYQKKGRECLEKQLLGQVSKKSVESFRPDRDNAY